MLPIQPLYCHPHGTFLWLQAPAPASTPDPSLGQRMDDHRDVMNYEGVEAMVCFELQIYEPYISTMAGTINSLTYEYYPDLLKLDEHFLDSLKNHYGFT